MDQYDYEQQWTIHDERESNMIGLETFTFDMVNRLDEPVQTVLEKLYAERQELWKEVERTRETQKSITPAKFPNGDDYEDALHDNQSDQMRAELDYHFNEEELTVFNEVRIMYAMKHLEINTKRLITAAFTGSSPKGMFKWEAIADFLKNKSIDIKKIKGYKEVEELRQVNNYIKHAERQIINVKEFKNKEYSSDALQRFYLRVHNTPEEFLNALMSAIYDHLYKFDDKKIESMVKALALRMDQKTAKKLMKKLSETYK